MAAAFPAGPGAFSQPGQTGAFQPAADEGPAAAPKPLSNMDVYASAGGWVPNSELRAMKQRAAELMKARKGE